MPQPDDRRSQAKRRSIFQRGHHCTQPLMHRLGVESTARASFYFYNTQAEVDRFVEVVKEIQKFFGHKSPQIKRWQPGTECVK